MQSLDYYQNLLSSEWRGATRMNAWLTANLQLFQDVVLCKWNMQVAAFDLDLAVGAQLDILGLIIGQSRTLNYQPESGSPDVELSPVLDDDTYRLLLKAGVARNHWDGKMPSLLMIWKSLFPGGTATFTDGQNMTVSILLSGSFTPIIVSLLLHGLLLPRPQGVRYDYAMATLPILGFDRVDSFIAGFDIAYFA